MRHEWPLLLLYMAFIPLSIFLVLYLFWTLGTDIIVPFLGFSLTVASFVTYRYLPGEEHRLKMSLGIASSAFWLFLLIQSFVDSGPDPLAVVLFVLSSWVLYVVSIEKN